MVAMIRKTLLAFMQAWTMSSRCAGEKPRNCMWARPERMADA
jgi:hypothetical protein